MMRKIILLISISNMGNNFESYQYDFLLWHATKYLYKLVTTEKMLGYYCAHVANGNPTCHYTR